MNITKIIQEKDLHFQPYNLVKKIERSHFLFRNEHNTMSNNITVNITTTADVPETTTQHVNDTIKAEARRRLLAKEAKDKAEAEAARVKADAERESVEARIREERITLLAEEEQVRIKARRLAVEAEAKRLANEKEAAITAEMERLKNRSKTEILEDKVAELTATLARVQEQCRCCRR